MRKLSSRVVSVLCVLELSGATSFATTSPPAYAANDQDRAPAVASPDPADPEGALQILEDKIRSQKVELAAVEARNTTLKSQGDRLAQYELPLQVASKILAICLFPALWLSTLVSNILVSVFFCLTVANGVAYFYFQRHDTFRKRKFLIVLAAVSLIAMFISPSFAEGESPSTPSLHEDLTRASQILRSHGRDRYIGILLARPTSEVRVPEFDTKSRYLTIITPVRRDTIEYHYTLAALYSGADDQDSAASTIVSMCTLPTVGSAVQDPQRRSLVLGAVRHLVDVGQSTAAGQAWDHLQRHLTATASLVEMAAYFSEHGLDDLERRSVDRAMMRSRSADDFFMVARYLAQASQLTEAQSAVVNAVKSKPGVDTVESALAFSRKHGLEEEPIWEAGIATAPRAAESAMPPLLQVAELAIRSKAYIAATQAVQKFAIYLGGKASAYEINAGALFRDIGDDLATQPILLQTALGIVSYRAGDLERARVELEAALRVRLKPVIDTFGYDTDIPLADLAFYRGFLTEIGDERLRAEVDSVYQALEQIRPQRDAGVPDEAMLAAETRLEQVRGESQLLEGRLEEMRTMEHALRSGRRAAVAKLGLYGARITALVIVIGVLVGSVVARTYAFWRLTTRFRLYATMAKFIEALGWSYSVTVISALPGFGLVFLGQKLLLPYAEQKALARIAHLGNTENGE